MTDESTPSAPGESATPEPPAAAPASTPKSAGSSTPEASPASEKKAPASPAAPKASPSTTAPASPTAKSATLASKSKSGESKTIAAPIPDRPPTGAVGTYSWGTGRRKAAVARVRLRVGSGKFLIRGREVDDYFFDLRHRNDVVAPLKATSTFGKFDVFVNVHGGGQMGQAGAIVLGVARALMKEDPSLESSLRDGRFLTRDARKVERKKPGQPGARKRFQFSKR